MFKKLFDKVYDIVFTICDELYGSRLVGMTLVLLLISYGAFLVWGIGGLLVADNNAREIRETLTSPPAEVQGCINECALGCGGIEISNDEYGRSMMKINAAYRNYCWNKCFVKCEEK